MAYDGGPTAPSTSSCARIQHRDDKIAAWLDACPMVLTDAQRARVMEIIAGEGDGQ